MHRVMRDGVLPVLVALAMAFVIQAAVAKPYEIPTGSMIPAIKEHDRIIANRLVYRLRDIRRGDIVVFTPPPAAVATCQPPPGVPFVKRVVGLPGDRVAVADGRTMVNGHEMVVPGAATPHYTVTFPRVPEGRLLLLGDNRNASCDSHLWGTDGFGVVAPGRVDRPQFAPIANVIGQAEVVYWPPRRMAFLA